MNRGNIASLWNKIFGKKNSRTPPAVTFTLRPPPLEGQAPSSRAIGESPMSVCQETLSPVGALCPACSGLDTTLPNAPEWFMALQAHVNAVQANDTAVRLFRAGQLEAAITELQRGLDVNPHYATGYSNLGFLYLRLGRLEQAVACLLRALEVDPDHQDAPDHLCDVLLALVDVLAHIGLTDGFLATQPGVKFDAYNRHIRTRNIGGLIAMIGKRGVFKLDGQVLETDLLMELVLHAVQKQMGAHCPSSSLRFAWRGIDGWEPSPAIPLLPLAHRTSRWGDRGPL